MMFEINRMNYSLSSGVADGVGGWREYGVDPSLFSSSLMEACRSLVDNKLIDLNPLTVTELLSRGYKQLLEDKQCIIGKKKRNKNQFSIRLNLFVFSR